MSLKSASSGQIVIVDSLANIGRAVTASTSEDPVHFHVSFIVVVSYDLRCRRRSIPDLQHNSSLQVTMGRAPRRGKIEHTLNCVSYLHIRCEDATVTIVSWLFRNVRGVDTVACTTRVVAQTSSIAMLGCRFQATRGRVPEEPSIQETKPIISLNG